MQTGYSKVDYATAPTLFNNQLVFKVVDVSIYDNILDKHNASGYDGRYQLCEEIYAQGGL